MADFATDDFYLVDVTDRSKKSVFDCSALTTAQVSTLSVPNLTAGISYTGTLALTNLSPQTFPSDQIFSGNLIIEAADNSGSLWLSNTTSGFFHFIQATTRTTSRTIEFPDLDGTVLLDAGAQTITGLKTFRDTTIKITDDADASKTLVFSLGGNSANADGTIATVFTTDKTVTIPDIAGTLMSLAGDQTITGTKTFGATVFDGDQGVSTFKADAPNTTPLLRLLDDTTGFGLDIMTTGAITGDGQVTIPIGGGRLVTTGTPVSTRIPFYSGTTGLVVNDADLTFVTDTLTATKIVAPTSLAVGGGVAVTGLPRPLFNRYADVGNVGTGEDDLYSDTTAASTLATDGQKIKAHYAGTFVSSATATRRLRAYFGGTAIYDSTALSLSTSSDWDMVVEIIRESSTVVRCSVKVNTTSASSAPYCTYTRITGLTLSSTNILKITGEAAGVGAADSDIVAKFGDVWFVNAA